MAHNKQTILNFTPHDVHVHIDDETIQTYLAPQKPYKEIRLDAEDQKLVLTLENGVKVVEKPVYKKLVNFPFERPLLADAAGINHPDIIVSMIVGEHIEKAAPWFLGAVYVPDTGPKSAVRDKGRILGVKRFYIAKQRTKKW